MGVKERWYEKWNRWINTYLNTPTQLYGQTVLILNNPSKHSPKRFADHQGMYFIIRLRRASVFFWASSGFLLTTPPLMSFLASFGLWMYEQWSLLVQEKLQFLYCCLWVFYDFLDELSMYFWRNVRRSTNLGRFATMCCFFFSFGDNTSHCGSLRSPRAFEIAL